MFDNEKLLAAGINYESGVKRFAGKAAIYEKFLARFPADTNFNDMLLALRGEDYDSAFRYAHTLKGVTGNLSLDGLYEKLVPLVEILRAKRVSEIAPLMDGILQSYNQTIAAIS